MRRDLFKRLLKVDIPVYEFPYLCYEVLFASIYLRFTGKQYDLVLDQIVVSRERDQLRIGSEVHDVLYGPATGTTDGKKRPPQLRAEYHLNNRAIIENRRCRGHNAFFVLPIGFHSPSLCRPRQNRRRAFMPIVRRLLCGTGSGGRLLCGGTLSASDTAALGPASDGDDAVVDAVIAAVPLSGTVVAADDVAEMNGCAFWI